MGYKPRIVTGKVTGTGWPIDGHVLYFTQWEYDHHDSFHLEAWDKADDEAVMRTIFQSETEAGLCACDTLEDFTKQWKAHEWEPQGAFCLPLDQVEVQKVVQEEQKDDPLRRGFLCLPMEKNLDTADVKARHPEWEQIKCPRCGRGCWKPPVGDRLASEQGVLLLCTECALEAGFERRIKSRTD